MGLTTEREAAQFIANLEKFPEEIDRAAINRIASAGPDSAYILREQLRLSGISLGKMTGLIFAGAMLRCAAHPQTKPSGAIMAFNFLKNALANKPICMVDGAQRCAEERHFINEEFRNFLEQQLCRQVVISLIAKAKELIPGQCDLKENPWAWTLGWLGTDAFDPLLERALNSCVDPTSVRLAFARLDPKTLGKSPDLVSKLLDLWFLLSLEHVSRDFDDGMAELTKLCSSDGAYQAIANRIRKLGGSLGPDIFRRDKIARMVDSATTNCLAFKEFHFLLVAKLPLRGSKNRSGDVISHATKDYCSYARRYYPYLGELARFAEERRRKLK